ncbi:MAG: response regulator transcription factor [Treponema sp.]|nr:response regulator transcription factor [Treponema sp.]
MEKLKILLADDQSLFAQSLQIFLNNYAPDMTVLGIASNGKEACDFVTTNTPDIILMDVRMPVMDGVEAVKHIKSAKPSVKIIMLSTYDEDEFVRNAILAGASGYLLKDISPTELIISIRALNSGIIQISPSLAQKLIQNTYVENKSNTDENLSESLEWLKTLTKREREIFALIATGHDNDEIADTLGLAVQTVRNQVSTIYSKLDVKDRFEIIKLANKVG